MAKKRQQRRSSYSDREVLELYVETVDDLLASDFAAQLQKSVVIRMTWANGRAATSVEGPSRESVKATLLTLRFFCQDNEPTSLRNMAARLPGLAVDQVLKDNFLTSRTNFNRGLDGPLAIPVQAVGANTRRELFKAFLYGAFAHANPRYRRLVKQWQSQMYMADLEGQFAHILGSFISALSFMAHACRGMLKQLPPP